MNSKLTMTAEYNAADPAQNDFCFASHCSITQGLEALSITTGAVGSGQTVSQHIIHRRCGAEDGATSLRPGSGGGGGAILVSCTTKISVQKDSQ